jgi:hypothetical protein
MAAPNPTYPIVYTSEPGVTLRKATVPPSGAEPAASSGYARAPDGPGYTPNGARPTVTQRNPR